MPQNLELSSVKHKTSRIMENGNNTQILRRQLIDKLNDAVGEDVEIERQLKLGIFFFFNDTHRSRTLS